MIETIIELSLSLDYQPIESMFLDYKSLEVFSYDKIHRYIRTLIINENNNLDILILLKNPSEDDNLQSSVILKILNIFKRNIYTNIRYTNIRSITFINLISVITKITDKNLIENNYDNTNIEFIKKILNNIKYGEIFITVGQDLIRGLTNIFNETYKEIMNLILEKKIKLKFFGKFVGRNKNIPCNPARMSYNDIKLLDLDESIIINHINRL